MASSTEQWGSRGSLKPRVEGVEIVSLSRGGGDHRASTFVVFDDSEGTPHNFRIVGA